jgi:hypothetical protein
VSAADQPAVTGEQPTRWKAREKEPQQSQRLRCALAEDRNSQKFQKVQNILNNWPSTWEAV